MNRRALLTTTRILIAATVLAAQTPAAAARQQAPASIDAAALMRDLETLAADSMEGRRAGTPGGLKARDYIVRRFKEVGIEPIGGKYERPFTFKTPRDTEERSGANIIGAIKGRAANGPWIVVTAHYDHLGVRNGEVFNGADDNASGVAALLAVADSFRKARPEHSILFAALDAEESGLVGARELLRNPPVPIESIALNVNLDMVARDAENKLFAVGTYHYPFLKRHLEGVARPPVKLLFGHDEPKTKQDDWTRDSDHFPFHEKGIPFVYFGVEDEAQHHKATDEVETVTKAFFIGAANTIAAAVRRFDAGLEDIRQKK
jgi:Zn-dependent M28 family amino/carboxypeptidase